MKDVDEPIHAFFFINKTVLELSGNELAGFQSAVISRIPKLVDLSRQCFLQILFEDHAGSSITKKLIYFAFNLIHF